MAFVCYVRCTPIQYHGSCKRASLELILSLFPNITWWSVNSNTDAKLSIDKYSKTCNSFLITLLHCSNALDWPLWSDIAPASTRSKSIGKSWGHPTCLVVSRQAALTGYILMYIYIYILYNYIIDVVVQTCPCQCSLSNMRAPTTWRDRQCRMSNYSSAQLRMSKQKEEEVLPATLRVTTMPMPIQGGIATNALQVDQEEHYVYFLFVPKAKPKSISLDHVGSASKWEN